MARQSSLKKLGRTFFRQSAAQFASGIVGKILVRRIGDRLLRARIVEAEAYLGPDDLASHSSRGRTGRTQVMFGPPGRAYVYFIYGMHQMLNVVVGKKGEAHAVLLRAAQPLDGWQANLRGPGLLAKGFHITAADYGRDFTGKDLYFLDNPDDRPRVAVSARIGVDYAGRWRDELLRFCDADSRFVSKAPRRASEAAAKREALGIKRAGDDKGGTG